MTGRIELRDVRALGVHGVLEHERERPQPFSCDVDAWLDVGNAVRSDELRDTVDYGALASLVAGVVTERSFLLLERLAGEIAAQVLDTFPKVSRVSVTVRKVRPPIRVDAGSVGVSVEARRPG